MTSAEVQQTIDDFANCAKLAQYAGYDGVEIMGSEGYLINEFIAARTNHRDDEWGGSYENRIRFPVEIVKRTREIVGENFVIIYRLSMLDLVEGGSTLEEVIQLAKAIEKLGLQSLIRVLAGMKLVFQQLPLKFQGLHLLGSLKN